MESKQIENQIPKVIHYCWFGRSNKSKFINKCMNSWSKHLPDYKIIEWNENNFDINCNKYVKEAYAQKKYAFVSDVARLNALYNYGGVYFDTDIEVRKSLDKYLNKARVIMAFESKKIIMTGFFCTRKNDDFIKKWLNQYDNLVFIDENGKCDLTPNTFRVTDLLVEEGLKLNGLRQSLKEDIEIFPNEIFGAYDVDNSTYNENENTVIIHHYNSSWRTKSYKVKDFMKRYLSKLLGVKRYSKLRLRFNGIMKKNNELF